MLFAIFVFRSFEMVTSIILGDSLVLYEVTGLQFSTNEKRVANDNPFTEQLIKIYFSSASSISDEFSSPVTLGRTTGGFAGAFGST